MARNYTLHFPVALKDSAPERVKVARATVSTAKRGVGFMVLTSAGTPIGFFNCGGIVQRLLYRALMRAQQRSTRNVLTHAHNGGEHPVYASLAC